MKIKWGMMMTDGRGKLGGQVASKNRAGAYIRTKVTPSNPRTSFQSTVRQNLAILSKSWHMLPEKLRNSWNAAADSGDWNRTDIFGDSRKPTGKNLFTSINLNSIRVTGNGIADVPQKASFSAVSTTSLAAIFAEAAEAVSLSLVLQAKEDVILGTRFEIQATPPVSAGRSYFENDFRNISTSNQVTEGVNTIDLSAEWGDKFGSVSAGQVGSKIAIRYRQVLYGQVTPWQSVVAIVAEPTP